MTWSFTAHGLAQDAQAAARLLEELRGVFSDPSHGTLSTSFASPEATEANFHAVAPTEPTIPAPPEAPETGSPEAADPAAGEAEEHPADQGGAAT